MASTTPTADPVAATPAGAAEAFMPLTITHLVLIALAIAATIVMIWWGRQLKQRRDEGEEGLEDRGSIKRVDDRQPATDDAAVNPPAPRQAMPDLPAAKQPAPDQPAAVPEHRAPEPIRAPAAAPAEPVATPPVKPAQPAPPVRPAPVPVTPPPPPVVLAEVPGVPVMPMSVPAIDAADLTTLKGLGPKVAGQLNALGIVTIADLADLSPDRAEAIDAQLGPFTGRMARDRWIEQARLLNAGDRAGYEAKFGKLGG